MVSFNTDDCFGGVKYLDNEEGENEVMSIAYISRRGMMHLYEKNRKSGVKKPSNKNADNDTEQQQQIPFIANQGAAASREIKYNFDIQWNLCNPISCDIRQKFMVPKYFC